MNKSKITAMTAIATVMSASAAHADLSLAGAMAGNISSGDATSGVSHGVSTSSIYVSYSSTLDNGMDMSAGFSSTGSGNNYSISIDTGMMGSVSFGETHSSAVDKMDGMPAGVNTISGTVELGGATKYSDGDSEESMGLRYTSPSFGGWTVMASIGEDSANTRTTTGERTSSIAVGGSVAGVSLALSLIHI